MGISGDLNEAMAPYQSPDLTTFNNAIGSMFEQAEELSSDTDADSNDGWSIIVDPDRCPDYGLGWLAQVVGARLPVGISEAEKRLLIKTPPNWQRGRISAMVAAAKRKLTGTKTVIPIERDGVGGVDDAYRLTMVVYSGESGVAVGTYGRTSRDSAGIWDAIRAVMNPGVLNLVVAPGWLISSMEAAGYANIAALEAAFPNIGILEVHT